MLHVNDVESSLSQDALRAKAEYLELVNPTHRSHVTNLYLEAARAGLRKPGDIVARVLAVVTRKLAEATTPEEVAKWTAIRATLATGAALDFAAYSVHYVNLPTETRRRLKASKQAAYLEQHLEALAATPAQLTLLRRMGWTGDPTVSTRAEAAALIGALLAGRGGSRG